MIKFHAYYSYGIPFTTVVSVWILTDSFALGTARLSSRLQFSCAGTTWVIIYLIMYRRFKALINNLSVIPRETDN